MALTPPTYTFQRGEPATYGLRVVSGDPAGYSVTAKLKPVGSGQVTPPDSSVASVATFSPAFVPASGSDAAYWTLTLSAAQTLGLPAGRYIADELLTVAGVPQQITEPAIIVLKNSVSG